MDGEHENGEMGQKRHVYFTAAARRQVILLEKTRHFAWSSCAKEWQGRRDVHDIDVGSMGVTQLFQTLKKFGRTATQRD